MKKAFFLLCTICIPLLIHPYYAGKAIPFCSPENGVYLKNNTLSSRYFEVTFTTQPGQPQGFALLPGDTDCLHTNPYKSIISIKVTPVMLNPATNISQPSQTNSTNNGPTFNGSHKEDRYIGSSLLNGQSFSTSDLRDGKKSSSSSQLPIPAAPKKITAHGKQDYAKSTLLNTGSLSQEWFKPKALPAGEPPTQPDQPASITFSKFHKNTISYPLSAANSKPNDQLLCRTLVFNGYTIQCWKTNPDLLPWYTETRAKDIVPDKK